MRNLLACLMIALLPGLAAAEEMKTTNRFAPDPRNTEKEHFEGPHVPEILTEDHWETVVKASKDAPVFVFKHSTQCEISAGAAYRTNAFLSSEAKKNAPKFYYVKVIETKPVSQTIEAETKVKHESPQLLLLEDGKAVWNTSHENITAEAIQTAMKEHGAVGKDEGSRKKRTQKKGYKKY